MQAGSNSIQNGSANMNVRSSALNHTINDHYKRKFSFYVGLAKTKGQIVE